MTHTTTDTGHPAPAPPVGQAGDGLAVAQAGAADVGLAVTDRLPIIQRASAVAARRARLAGHDAADVEGETVARLLAAVVARPADSAVILSPAYIGKVAGAAAQAVRRANGQAIPAGTAADLDSPAPRDTGDTGTLREHYRRTAVIGKPKRTDVHGVADDSRWAMRDTGDRFEREMHREATVRAMSAPLPADTVLLDVAPLTAGYRAGWRTLTPPPAPPTPPPCATHGAGCEATGKRCRPFPTVRAPRGYNRQTVARPRPVRAGDTGDTLAAVYSPERIRQRTRRDDDGAVIGRAGDVIARRRLRLPDALPDPADRPAYHRARRAVSGWAGDVTRYASGWATRLAPPRTGEVADTLPPWHPARTGDAVTPLPSGTRPTGNTGSGARRAIVDDDPPAPVPGSPAARRAHAARLDAIGSRWHATHTVPVDGCGVCEAS